jgi:hypothetical protein
MRQSKSRLLGGVFFIYPSIIRIPSSEGFTAKPGGVEVFVNQQESGSTVTKGT